MYYHAVQFHRDGSGGGSVKLDEFTFGYTTGLLYSGDDYCIRKPVVFVTNTYIVETNSVHVSDSMLDMVRLVHSLMEF